ncbi:MAG: hypothetical protein WA101_02660, partial [Minisyncoccia bacterium]
MKLTKHIFKKYFVYILSFVFLIMFTTTLSVFAVGGPYAPGDTLNPDCLPGVAGCVVTIPSGGWGLTGTSGTVDGTNFIGTTD